MAGVIRGYKNSYPYPYPWESVPLYPSGTDFSHGSITHGYGYEYGLSTDYPRIYIKIYVHIMLWGQLKLICGITYGWLVCIDQQLWIHRLVSTPGWSKAVEKWVRYSQNTVFTVSHSFLNGFWWSWSQSKWADQWALIWTPVSTPGSWERVKKWVRYCQNTVLTVSHSFLNRFGRSLDWYPWIQYPRIHGSPNLYPYSYPCGYGYTRIRIYPYPRHSLLAQPRNRSCVLRYRLCPIP